MHLRRDIGAFSQRFVTPLSVGGTALALAAAILLIYLVSLFIDINTAVQAQTDDTREDMVWAVYQLEREATGLDMVLHDDTLIGDARIRALTEHYDILYSRTDLVSVGQIGKKFGEVPKLLQLVQTVAAEIKAMAPTFDEMTAARQIDRPTIVHLKGALAAIRKSADALIIATNARHNDIKVADRAALRANYIQIAWTAAGLGAVIAAVVGLMIVQLRQIRRLSEQHRSAARQADAANRAKSTFLAAMSHEIRTPLNGIIGMTELLDESPMSAEHKAQIGVIRHSGDVLLEVINDILDFSKLESGDVDLDETAFELRDLFEGVAHIMSPRAGKKGLTFELEAPEASIVSDPARLRQVLINLVGNAIKFTEAGRVSVTAQLIARTPTDATLRVQVTDTGIGMSEATRAQLFQEFVQGDRSISRRFGGTGLGLAICKRLVEALGGSIDVDSREGVGTAFSFEVPCRPVAASVAPAERQQVVIPAGKHILLVEDNAINQQVAEGLLQRMGLRVSLANDGAAAITAFDAGRYDAVLMDMQMPVMDGLSATRALRAAGHTLPIIGLTANAFASDRDDCLAAGMTGFVSKPVTRHKLEEALVAALVEPRSVNAGALADERGAAVDVAQQQALIAELGETTFTALMADFVAEGARLVADAEAGAREERIRALHTLKGMAATLGLSGIAAAAQAAEMAMRQTGTASLASLSQQIADSDSRDRRAA